MKIKYCIMSETGVQGIKYYEDMETAQRAANTLTTFSNFHWYVKEVITRI